MPAQRPALQRGAVARRKLFVTQGHDGVDAHGAAGGDVAGGEGNEREQNGDGGKGRRALSVESEESKVKKQNAGA
jgi:hypothetical protein